MSLDGLILKNKLGIGTYLKYETFERTDQTNYFNYNINTNKTINTYTFSNVYMGFMVAPKFELKSKDEQKPSHLLSPALAIGFKGSQFNYMGNDFYNATLQDTTRNGQDINSFDLEYVSAALAYSSPTSYSGIKLNFQNYLHSFILYDVSFLYSKTYFDKTVSTPRFSFTHQFQLTLPTYGFFNYRRYSTTFDKLNRNNLMHYFTANLDFKYDMYVLGMFVGLNDYDGVYAGLTAGIQIDRMKILINYSPRLSSKKYGSSGLFVSANFYLKGKKVQ